MLRSWEKLGIPHWSSPSPAQCVCMCECVCVCVFPKSKACFIWGWSSSLVLLLAPAPFPPINWGKVPNCALLFWFIENSERCIYLFRWYRALPTSRHQKHTAEETFHPSLPTEWALRRNVTGTTWKIHQRNTMRGCEWKVRFPRGRRALRFGVLWEVTVSV